MDWMVLIFHESTKKIEKSLKEPLNIKNTINNILIFYIISNKSKRETK